MLDKQTRGAILVLRRKGHSLRCISRLLSLSRDSVRKVLKRGSDEPPIICRPRKLDVHRERIVQMLAQFDGNVVKVHRALADAGGRVSLLRRELLRLVPVRIARQHGRTAGLLRRELRTLPLYYS